MSKWMRLWQERDSYVRSSRDSGSVIQVDDGTADQASGSRTLGKATVQVYPLKRQVLKPLRSAEVISKVNALRCSCAAEYTHISGKALPISFRNRQFSYVLPVLVCMFCEKNFRRFPEEIGGNEVTPICR